MRYRLRFGFFAGVIVGWAITLGSQATPDAWVVVTPIPILLILFTVYTALDRWLPNADPVHTDTNERGTDPCPSR